MKKITLIFMCVGFLSACNSEEIKTVEWYKGNEAERNQMIDKCKNDHSLDGNANCKNAITARSSMRTNKMLHGDGNLFK